MYLLVNRVLNLNFKVMLILRSLDDMRVILHTLHTNNNLKKKQFVFDKHRFILQMLCL